jgi:hypothetical protein
MATSKSRSFSMKIVKVIVGLIALVLASPAQNAKPSSATIVPAESSAGMRVKSTAKVAFTGSVMGRIKCDDSGSIYARLVDAETSKQYHGSSFLPVKKIKQDGTIASVFSVSGEYPSFKVSDFFIAGDGRVFQAARSDSEGDVYVVSFSDSTPAGKAVRLETDYFIPYQIAVFKSGEFLLSGISGDHNRTPFTAVFGPNGKLIKSIYEAEDDDAKQRAEKGESDFRLDQPRYGNSFVTHGDAVLGSDGNVYLLRASNPALIYVISNRGEVIRKLRIASPSSGLVSRTLKSSSGKLAIGFLKKGMNQGVMVIVDYDGHVLSSHSGDDSRMLPGLVACYDTQGFNFIGFDDESGMQIHRVELK